MRSVESDEAIGGYIAILREHMDPVLVERTLNRLEKMKASVGEKEFHRRFDEFFSESRNGVDVEIWNLLVGEDEPQINATNGDS